MTADDIKLALVPVAQKSGSVYKSVNMLYKSIFDSAIESHIISTSPCQGISWKGGKPQKERAWHSEHNRPVISTELKTNAARRDVPLPDQLVECLRETKAKSKSDFVIATIAKELHKRILIPEALVSGIFLITSKTNH